MLLAQDGLTKATYGPPWTVSQQEVQGAGDAETQATGSNRPSVVAGPEEARVSLHSRKLAVAGYGRHDVMLPGLPSMPWTLQVAGGPVQGLSDLVTSVGEALGQVSLKVLEDFLLDRSARS